MIKTYIVNKGDNLWNIARKNKLSLEELIKLNPSKKNMIFPGDELRLELDKVTEEVDFRKERIKEKELNLENISAIQGYKHNDNYVVIDKKNRQLTVYDKDNNPLYVTKDFATGASGEDYNTITYIDERGIIRSGQGNNSTPAGISEISGKGTYHGYPSFTRARLNKDGSKEDVASSLHWGNIGTERNASNGCVRIGGKTLCDIEPYLSTGIRVYTLPEKEGSRFTLKGGKLNFTADNPYGETEGSKKYWDDYNVYTDKTYSPLKLTYKKSGDKEYDDNRYNYSKALVNNKKDLQKRFNLSSFEYNQLAEFALGIAEQESKFGTATRYKAKRLLGDDYIQALKVIKNGKLGAISRGLSQIKLNSDNEEMQKHYKDLNINKNNITDAYISGIATIARLAHIYNTEVKGRKFTTSDGHNLDPYHALMYKWMGKNKELVNKTATPSKNIYIRNVNNYARNFGMYDIKTYSKY